MTDQIDRLGTSRIEELSNWSLSFLADELAMNYFNTSQHPSEQPNKEDNSVYSIIEDVFYQKEKRYERTGVELDSEHEESELLSISEIHNPPSLSQWELSEMKTVDTYSRNILIVGAGASFNKFQSVPLGWHATKMLYSSRSVESIEVKLCEINSYGFSEDEKTQLKDNGTVSITLFDVISLLVVQEGDNEKYIDFYPVKAEWRRRYLILLDNRSIQPSTSEQHILDIVEQFVGEYTKLKLGGSDKKLRYEWPEFETALLLLENFVPLRSIQKGLKDLYNYRHGTNHFYSIVAHMLKHRIIDVVINFNFDELLDQCIVDELGDSNYHTVISDRDAARINESYLEQYEDSTSGTLGIPKLSHPLYIKPHGTASDLDSMRFTKGHYVDISPNMESLLTNLISAKEDGYRKRVNLISVGFEMKSVEFNEILRRCLTRNDNLFWFIHHSNHKELVDSIKSKHLYIQKEWGIWNDDDNSESKNIGLYFIPHEFEHLANKEDYSSHTLGGVFRELYRRVASCFKKPFKPASISRHVLEDMVFGDERLYDCVQEDYGTTLEYFQSSDYLLDRTFMEVAIAISKSRGRIDLRVLAESWPGIYYSHYIRACRKEKKEKKEIITLVDLASIFLHFRIAEEKSIDGHKQFVKPFGIESLPMLKGAKSILAGLIENQEEIMGDCVSKSLKQYLLKLVREDQNHLESISKIFEEFESQKKSSITLDFITPVHHAFIDYDVHDLLHTDLSIGLQFLEGLEDKRTKSIYMIAESGVQLKKFKDFWIDSEIQVWLILVNDHIKPTKDGSCWENQGKEREIETLRRIKTRSVSGLQNNCSLFDKSLLKLNERINIQFLRSEVHNHHMTVFTSSNLHPSAFAHKQITNEEAIRAIYYYQEGISQRIKPIRIKEARNVEDLLTKFQSLWKKAEDYTNRGL